MIDPPDDQKRRLLELERELFWAQLCLATVLIFAAYGLYRFCEMVLG